MLARGPFWLVPTAPNVSRMHSGCARRTTRPSGLSGGSNSPTGAPATVPAAPHRAAFTQQHIVSLTNNQGRNPQDVLFDVIALRDETARMLRGASVCSGDVLAGTTLVRPSAASSGPTRSTTADASQRVHARARARRGRDVARFCRGRRPTGAQSSREAARARRSPAA